MNKKISLLIAAAMSTSITSTVMPNKRLITKNNTQLAINKKKEQTKNSNYVVENNLLATQTISLNGMDDLNPAFEKISFNTINQSLSISCVGEWSSMASPNINTFKITLYNIDGKIIKSKVYNNNLNPYDIQSDFSIKYKYGDILSITPYNGCNLNVNNFDGQSNYTSSTETNFLITKSGLKNLNKNLKLNSAYINNNQLDITGETAPNQVVSIYVNNEIYKTTSNNKGTFSIIIDSKKPLTEKTEVEVFVKDYGLCNITPKFNPNLNNYKNHISFIRNYNDYLTNIFNLQFNPYNNTISIDKAALSSTFSGAMESNSRVLTFSFYNSNGALLKNINYYANESIANLYNDLNGLKFNYGEIIKITGSNNIYSQINDYHNQTLYKNQNQEFIITKGGLVPTNLKQVVVNPFDILGEGNVYSGTLTGKTINPNSEVQIKVNNKIFNTISNKNGIFKVDITDKNGFNENTSIHVTAKDQLGVVINPTISNNLQLKYYTINTSPAPGVYPEILSFNPLTKKLTANLMNSYSFGFQILNGKNGNLESNVEAPGCNIFPKSNNELGNNYNYNYNYGDIISIYENKTNKLKYGSPYIVKQENSDIISATKLNCTDDVVSYIITPHGLVPVENKNLKTSQIIYNNNPIMKLTGETLPNKKVTISYGNKVTTVTSNNKGTFFLDIPYKDAPEGTSVRIFVNNENEKTLIVKYDQNILSQMNNHIIISNNYNIPIADLGINCLNKNFVVSIDNSKNSIPGSFYSNGLNISVINPHNGQIKYNYNSNSIDELSNLNKIFNNKNYQLNDIIKISYNPNLIKVGVYNNKNNIGDTTGQTEYFQITDNGFEKINSNLITVSNLDFLNGNKIYSTNLKGQVNPNAKVEININGKTFNGISDSKGIFDIKVSDLEGFNEKTKITLTSTGYIPTIVTPTINSDISLNNNFINFYGDEQIDNGYGGTSKLLSSIGFNPASMKMTVLNNSYSFGNGSSNYFTLGLYNPDGSNIFNDSFNNGSTSELYSKINGQPFKYGDILSLKYNNNISKVTILNGNKIINNISGETEYFKITKQGLKQVNFGNVFTINSAKWNNGNLKLNITLASGNTLNNNSTKFDLLDNGKVVNSISVQNTNTNILTVILNQALLSSLSDNKNYTFALNVNGKLYNINSSGSFNNYKNYILSENNNQELILTKYKIRTKISNSNDISTLQNNLNSTITNELNNNSNLNSVINNTNLNYDIITNEFINRVGKKNLEKLFNENENNKIFINWLLNNKIAMSEYLNGVNPNSTIDINSLQIWSKIWNKYSNSRSGFNLKLAIAVSIANAKPIIAWPTPSYYNFGNINTTSVGSPIERYNIFEQLNANNRMLPIFKTLNVKHLEYVVNTRISNSQIMELRDILLQGFNKYISTPSKLNLVGFTVNYSATNKEGKSRENNVLYYGTNHPTVADVWYQGGVCYSISNISVGACQVFGVPAMTLGQPAHCPYLYFTNDHKWVIGYNVFGITATTGGDISGWSNGLATNDFITSYDYVYQAADNDKLIESNQYLWASKVSNLSYSQKLNLINKAILVQPLNVIAWEDKITLMESNSNTTGTDYFNVAKKIVETFKDYPQPMFDLIVKLKNKLRLNVSQEQFNEIVAELTNTLTYDQNNNIQSSVSTQVLGELKNQGLVIGNNLLSLSKINISTFGFLIGTIGFNTSKKEFVITNTNPTRLLSGYNYYLNIKVYNPETKKITLEGKLDDDSTGTKLSNLLNGKNFNYGDIITISSYLENTKVLNSLGEVIGTTSTGSGSESFEITANGLIPYIDTNKNSTNNKSDINHKIKNTDNKSDINHKIKNIDNKSDINHKIKNTDNKSDINHKIKNTDNKSDINHKIKNIDNKSGINHKTENTDNKSDINHKTKNTDNKADIKQHNSTVSSLKSNSEDIYWDYSSLVINGNINLDNEVLSKNTQKEIIIKNSKGNIVTSSNTVAVNWYSKDKNNYSGYQGIFTKEQLSKLNPNEVYSVCIEVDGKEVPIVNSIKLSNKEYKISNKNGDLTIERNGEKLLNVGTYETGYFTNFGYVLNGNINLDNDIFSKANIRELVVKDTSGSIVDKVNCASMNWYSENKDNYSGFQGIITNSVLSKLKAGEKYTFEIEVNYKGKVYNLPIENTKNFILNTSMEYNIGVNAENNIVISKMNTQASRIGSIQGVFKDGYWQPYGYVMNLEVNAGKDIPKGTKMELISKNEDGKVLSVTPGVDVNWYSNNKKNYNGFQAIITPDQLINETGTNKLYVRVVLNGKVYEAPVSGNVDVAMSNLNYGFKTINNQIYIIRR